MTIDTVVLRANADTENKQPEDEECEGEPGEIPGIVTSTRRTKEDEREDTAAKRDNAARNQCLEPSPRCLSKLVGTIMEYARQLLSGLFSSGGPKAGDKILTRRQ